MNTFTKALIAATTLAASASALKIQNDTDDTPRTFESCGGQPGGVIPHSKLEWCFRPIYSDVIHFLRNKDDEEQIIDRLLHWYGDEYYAMFDEATFDKIISNEAGGDFTKQMGLLYDAFVSLYTEYNEHWQSAYEDDEYDGEDPTARIGDWMHSHLNNEEFSLNWCSSEDHCGLDAFEELYSGKYGDGMFTSPSTFVTETLQIYHQYNGEGEWTFFNETVRSVVTRDEQATPAAIFERLFEAYAVDVEGEGKVITQEIYEEAVYYNGELAKGIDWDFDTEKYISEDAFVSLAISE